jgi:hypothetical protein
MPKRLTNKTVAEMASACEPRTMARGYPQPHPSRLAAGERLRMTTSIYVTRR